ncbi:MAG: putative ABC transporter ATP-binding protein [Actinobacteria bacterium ADurb.Bin346]|nr:MAG: putative ABC transporter ATP-binding protein [Actinobacteria bacterium ADurb.Bin346]
MFKLVKYLKPFTMLIILSLVLLFGQAMADLALPDYMSNIVNIGIQQRGIASALPEAIRQSELYKLTIFMSPSSKQEILNSYTLVDKNSAAYSTFVRKYPQLEKEPVYILKKLKSPEKKFLNPVMGRAFITVSFLEEMLKDPVKAADIGSKMGFDLSKIPEGTSGGQFFKIIANLPAGQLSKIRNAVNSRFASLDDKIVNQMAVGLVRNEYNALGMNTDKVQSSYMWKMGALMLLLSLASAVLTVSVGYLSARTAAGLSRNLRKKVFDKVESFSNTEFDKFSTASLITRSTNDITQIQMLIIIVIRIIFYAPIMGIGGAIRALGKSTSMSWIIALAVIVVISLILVVFSVSLPKFKIIQKLIDRLNLVIRENLSGMMVIRAFNSQKFEEGRFDKANIDLTKTSLFINRVMVTMMPVMMIIMNGLTLVIIWVGSHQVAQAHIQVGDVMAFMQYAMLIVISFIMLSVMFIMVPRASVSAGRVVEVIETESVIKDPEKPAVFDNELPVRGVVEFKNVSFRYPGASEYVLNNISFIAKPGQTTAFIGSTGSGKSTVVNLLLRFYDVSSGCITVDNLDIRSVTQHDLRNKIGYVPQKSMLFSGTIESNLIYADENADMDTIVKAAEVAQAMEFISAKQEGFNAEISQGGKNVSGGQNQRLSIARALVKKPEILILDDCFSALDFKTDAALRSALKTYSKNSTVIIVAQRVGTVMKAEQIVVLDEGRIKGTGTHKELMESCETYREIAYSQLSREELA